jgi:hypothetical protein
LRNFTFRLQAKQEILGVKTQKAKPSDQPPKKILLVNPNRVVENKLKDKKGDNKVNFLK